MNKTYRLQAMVTEDERQAVKLWSVQNKVSISELITVALNEHFESVGSDIRLEIPERGGDMRERGGGDDE